MPFLATMNSVAKDTVCLDLGGAQWLLRSHTEGLRMELDSRVAEFVSKAPGEPEVVVDIHWADEFRNPGPALFDAGTWRAYPAGDSVQFDFFTHILGPQAYKRAVFDREFKSGQVFLNRPLLRNLESYYPFEYPLDELASMHRLALGAGVELHSCGMMTEDGRGYLFVGHSGAGKSTMGKQWVKHRNAAILSDDRVVVTNDDKEYRLHGTPWHGEAGLAKNATADLKAIFLIQHAKQNATVPVKPAQAAAELFSRSFVPWYRANDLDFTASFLERLTLSVPVYIFHCLPEISAVEFLEREHAI